MRKIYIDCGAHLGKVSLEFNKKNSNYEFFLFEVNPELLPNLRKICKSNNNFKLIEKAVWIFDGKLSFYFGKNPKGSSILSKKINLDNRNIEVDCLDFSKWIIDNFHKDDYIYMKCDIEGAEFDVLEKMIDTGAIDYIDELKVEFHLGKIDDKNINRERQDRLISKLRLHTKISEESSHL